MSVRAFVPDASSSLAVGEVLTLDPEESRYLVKVRRLRAGACFELLDGRGGAWSATLVDDGKKCVRVQIDRVREPGLPIPERVVLLGLPDVTATLEALTGASELGASEVVMVRCERSQGRLPSGARMQRVLRASMRQCGRAHPLKLHPAANEDTWGLSTALAYRSELPGVLAHPNSTATSELCPGAPLRILVGPEGGLTEPEVELARAAGFETLALGPWILRTPTALVALLARLTPTKAA